MKKLISVFMILCVIFSLVGCNSKNQQNTEELIVFAAASMTESLTEIANQYTDNYPDITITCNFDSSGTLKTQIEEGADCDIFIAASQKPMDSLEHIITDTRFDLLENKITLVVPSGNPKSIHSFEDLIAHLKVGDVMLAIGNADVPVGEYTLKIFDHYQISESDLNAKHCLTYGSNVKEVTTQVNESMADCGIVYMTDAHTTQLEIVDIATEKMCGRVVYPAAVVSSSSNVELAEDFLNFLKSDVASSVLTEYGFTPLN